MPSVVCRRRWDDAEHHLLRRETSVGYVNRDRPNVHVYRAKRSRPKVWGGWIIRRRHVQGRNVHVYRGESSKGESSRERNVYGRIVHVTKRPSRGWNDEWAKCPVTERTERSKIHHWIECSFIHSSSITHDSSTYNTLKKLKSNKSSAYDSSQHKMH